MAFIGRVIRLVSLAVFISIVSIGSSYLVFNYYMKQMIPSGAEAVWRENVASETTGVSRTTLVKLKQQMSREDKAKILAIISRHVSKKLLEKLPNYYEHGMSGAQFDTVKKEVRLAVGAKDYHKIVEIVRKYTAN